MSERNDGGPAFPSSRWEALDVPLARPDGSVEVSKVAAEVSYPGLSVRDWFAGQAIAHTWRQAVWQDDDGQSDIDATVERAVGWAFKLADAMLAERAKGGAS